jgi:hypothetical protein
MLYPLAGGDATCATQPLITVKDIQLHNVTSHGGILPPGVIRCNETHPCTDFVWDNVHIHGWWRILGLGFITEFTSGTVTQSHPVPAFTNLGITQPTLYETMLGALLNIVENAWEQLWSNNSFVPSGPVFEQVPEPEPRRSRWDERPWAPFENFGRWNHMPEDRAPEEEQFSIVIIIQQLAAYFQ